jgi:hypothetical protein
MERAQELIKKYLSGNLGLGKNEKGPDCLDEAVLSDYLAGAVDEAVRKRIEYHLAGCGFCLSQLSIAFDSANIAGSKQSLRPPRKIIESLKSRLGIGPAKADKKKFLFRIGKNGFFLGAAIICFILSFIFSRYFMQFLVATLILGIRWAFDSQGGHTFITVLDTWRQQSQAKKESQDSRKKPL